MINELVVPIIVAFGASVLLTPLMQRIACRLGIVARPNPLVKTHTSATPYLGGIAVYLAFTMGLLVFDVTSQHVTLVLCAGLMLMVGLLDDIRPLSALQKLLAQIIVSTVALWLFSDTDQGHLNAPRFVLYLLWLLVTANALNLIDVMDGLATGVAALSFFGLCGAALIGGFSHFSITTLILCAALLGFLPFNRYRARIFLGDAGSLMIGFAFGLIPLSESQFMMRPSTWVVLLLLFTVPLFELAFVSVMRSLAGKPFWKGSRDHFSLRLLSLDWKVPRIAGITYALGAATMVAALVFELHSPRAIGWVAVVPVIGVALYAWRRLSKIEV